MYAYTIIIEKAPSNYAAYSPDVEGCGTTGATVEEVLEMMKEALEFHFEGLIESGQEVPSPKGLHYYMMKAENDAPLFHHPTDMIAFIEPNVLHENGTLAEL